MSIDLTQLWTGGVGTIGSGTIRNVERIGVYNGTQGNDNFVIGGTASVGANMGGGNDTVSGGSSNDSIDGGDGDDNLSGLGGNDTLYGRNGSDTVQGGAGDDYITGDQAAGGGPAPNPGNDFLDGGDGNDTIFGEGGNDTVLGGLGNDSIDGGAGVDYLIGGDGNDQVYGGTGTNTLQGGAGDDVYFLENNTDSIIEFAGEGNDEIRTALTVVTMASHVELLTYTGGAVSALLVGGATDNNISGGTGRDELFGRDGNDILADVGAAAGQGDFMAGGLGNDIYVISNIGSSTSEATGEGIDEVRTAISIYGLQANIENLTATDNGTHAALVGNSLDNSITGGTGRDDLFGREGNDTLIGGSGFANSLYGQEGDDIYIVSATGDSVIEFTGEGTDEVRASTASFTLGANVENLVYTGGGAFIGVGNNLGNAMTGGAGADSLNGLDGDDFITGGSGADILQGGAGADQFRYEGGETGFDRILDFVSGTDKIALRSAFFTPTGTVDFVSGGSVVATSANSTILYDTNTGIVWYDDDGNGAGAAVAIAQLNPGQTFAAGDFLFY